MPTAQAGTGSICLSPVYFHVCVPFLLCHVLQGVKAGSTMVPVWALTIAIMNGSERRGSSLCIFRCVTFHKAHFVFLFSYVLKGLKGATSCFCPSAGVIWRLTVNWCLKIIDYISSEDECGIIFAHEAKGSSKGAAHWKRREGYDITLYPLSYWVLGEKLGERLRGVLGGGGVDVGKQSFIQRGEFLAWRKMKWFVRAVFGSLFWVYGCFIQSCPPFVSLFQFWHEQ